MRNTIVFILAFILALFLIPIGFIVGLCRKSGKSAFLMDNSITIDISANVTCKYLFNWMLIKDDTLFPFGKETQTISLVLAWNKRFNNLTVAGIILAFFLNKVDTDHLEKTIELYESKKI